MITVRFKKPNLEPLKALMEDLKAPHGFQFNLSADAEKKLRFFTAQRHILAMTPYAQTLVSEAFVRGAQQALRAGLPPLKAGTESAAYELRRLYVERFKRNGGDVALKALSRAWVERKRRRGLDPRIGVSTGALAAAIANAKPIVR